MSNNSIWPKHKTLSGASTPGHSGPGAHGNEGVLHIPQSSSITEGSSSDCLVSYPGHWLGESYLSVEMQSVYSVAPAKWTVISRTLVGGVSPLCRDAVSVFGSSSRKYSWTVMWHILYILFLYFLKHLLVIQHH